MGRPATLQIRVTSDSQQAQQDVGQLPGKFDSAFSKLSQAGPAIGAAAGGLVAGALVDAFTKALGQSRMTAKLGAQLGATPAEAARFGKAAGSLYAKGITDSFEEGAAAIKATMQAGLLPTGATEAQIKLVSTKVADLASTFEQDSTQLARAVAQMVKTGLADSADEAFDVLTRGFQTGGDAAGDLLDTFSEYSTQFRKLGLDGQTAMGLITQGLKAGARDADIVADAFKEFSIRAIDGSKLTADSFKALGLDAEEMANKIAAGGKPASEALDLVLDRIRGMKDPVDQAAVSVGLFGTQSEDLGAALNALDPTTAVDALGQVEGATKRMGDQMRATSERDITVLWQSLQQKLVDTMNANVVPAVGAVSSKVQEASPILKDLATLVAGPVYFAWKLLEGILGTAVGTLRRVSDELGLSAGQSKGLGFTIRDGLLPFLSRLASQISGAVSPAITIFGSIISGAASAVGWLSDRIQGLISWLADLKSWFSSLSPPSWLSDIGGVFSSFSADAPTVQGFTAMSDTSGGATTFVSALRQAQFGSGRLSVAAPPVGVNVFIDGRQLDARTQRIVGNAMNQDGARWQARGWV